jgi:transcriptional regulator with XRE-family HTH domain
MIDSVDAIRFGRGMRAVRQRRGWRQSDLADAAGLSRSAVSRIELGRADTLTIRSLDAVASAVGARIDIRLSWNGEALDRLLDSVHARLVEVVLARLGACGWETSPEVSFSVYGERGSIDVLAFHRPTSSLLVVEVKSVVPDLQAMLSALDRKARLAAPVAAGRGWEASSVSRLLVIGDDRTARRRVDSFGATFGRAFPLRAWAVDRWLRDPDGAAISGLRFLSDDRQASTRHRIAHRDARLTPETRPGPVRTGQAPACGASVRNSASSRRGTTGW